MKVRNVDSVWEGATECTCSISPSRTTPPMGVTYTARERQSCSEACAGAPQQSKDAVLAKIHSQLSIAL